MGFLDAVTSLATKIAENIASGEKPKHDAESIRKDAAEAGTQAKAFGSIALEMLAKTATAAAPLAKSVLGAASEMAKSASTEFNELHGKVDAFATAKATAAAAPTAGAAAAPAAPASSVAEKVKARRGATKPTAPAAEPSKPAAKTSA